MASHSSTLAWRIPVTEEPGRLQSMGCKESDMTERLHFHFHALEKEMATHSSVLAWRIPGMGEPGGLPSMGLDRQSWTRLKRLSSSSRGLLCGLISTLLCLREQGGLRTGQETRNSQLVMQSEHRTSVH